MKKMKTILVLIKYEFFMKQLAVPQFFSFDFGVKYDLL